MNLKFTKPFFIIVFAYQFIVFAFFGIAKWEYNIDFLASKHAKISIIHLFLSGIISYYYLLNRMDVKYIFLRKRAYAILPIKPKSLIKKEFFYLLTSKEVLIIFLISFVSFEVILFKNLQVLFLDFIAFLFSSIILLFTAILVKFQITDIKKSNGLLVLIFILIFFAQITYSLKFISVDILLLFYPLTWISFLPILEHNYIPFIIASIGYFILFYSIYNKMLYWKK